MFSFKFVDLGFRKVVPQKDIKVLLILKKVSGISPRAGGLQSAVVDRWVFTVCL